MAFDLTDADDVFAKPKKHVSHEIGQSLDVLSLDDFAERIDLLKQEIARLEAAREKKADSLAAASAVFRV